MKKKVTQVQKSRKISSKIILSIISTNLLVLLIVGGIIGLLLNSNVGKQSNEFAIKEIEANLNSFEQDFSNVETAVNLIASDVSVSTDVERALEDNTYFDGFEEEYIPVLKKIGEDLGITRSIYVYFNYAMFNKEVDMWLYNDGSGFVQQPSLDQEGYYETDIPWYNDPVIHGKSGWSFPYLSETGSLITSYTVPIRKDNKIIGLAGMDLYLDDIKAKLDDVTLFKTGYLYLMDSEGKVILHPRFSWEKEDGTIEVPNILDAGDYQFLLDKMNAEDIGFEAYKRDDGQRVISAFGHLNNGWILGSSIPEKEVLAIVNLVVLILLIIALVAIVISVIIALIVGKTISRPILDVVKATEKIKEGDFTIQVQTKSKDETMLLANGLNEMTTSIKDLIGETKDVSRNMLDTASNLAAMSEETNATVDQVANTLEEISKGTQETAREAEKGAAVVHIIDEKFGRLMANSVTMKENAEIAIETNNTGLSALATLKEKSEIGRVSNEKITDAVKNLDEKTDAITNIIATITSIANQTNLLALNASIEAARAGEAGKGFAVVADEIRKLAEDSSTATDEIRSIVQNIQNDSRDTVEVMDEVSIISKEQIDAVSNVSDSFGLIFKAVENITKEIESVTSELNELNLNKNDIVEVVTNISAVSEETASATEEVNSSMSEQTIAVEEVAKNAEILNELSMKLNDHIQIFKV